MTNRQQVGWAVFILLWVGGCGIQHVRGREAMKQKIALERLEGDFFAAMGEGEELMETATKTTREVFAYAEG